MSKTRPAFEIGSARIAPGRRQTVDLPVSQLSDHTPVSMSVHVVHGRRPGPVLFVSAAIHGDEVIGVEIARRILRAPQLDRMRGTLLVVPIVNAFGFLNHSRYLPDRRDLNRSFRGAARGSLTGRLAHLFMTEVVARSDLGIDLHSAAMHRINLPQIRISATSETAAEMAQAFRAPVTIEAGLREGSLRAAAGEKGVDILLFEAGEALRLDETSAGVGTAGILRVMRAQSMIAGTGVPKARAASIRTTGTHWLRAPAGGLFRAYRTIGDSVEPDDVLGVVAGPFGEVETEVRNLQPGVIIGRRTMPMVNEGDALFHIGVTRRSDTGKTIDALTAIEEIGTLLDEDEIL